MKRAQAGAAPGRFGPPDHQEFLTPGAFDFQPVTAAPGAVPAIRFLADDTFQFHPTSGFAHGSGVALVVVAVAQHAVPGVQPLQPLLTVA